jgi:hypothetical protein
MIVYYDCVRSHKALTTFCDRWQPNVGAPLLYPPRVEPLFLLNLIVQYPNDPFSLNFKVCFGQEVFKK